MSRKLSFKLPIKAALLLFGLSIATVFAAPKDKPPVLEDFHLKAGPVVGGIFTCDITNYTDRDIEFSMEWCSGPRTTPGITPSCGEATGVLQPFANYGLGDLDGVFSSVYATDCAVFYTGLAGDITGVLCGTSGCVPLN